MDPISSSIITVYKLIDFCLTLKDVPAKSQLFITQLDRVRADLNEALRERKAKTAILDLCPGNKAWIEGAIHDTRRVLGEIGAQVEGPRVDLEVGRRVTLKHRFEWVIWNHQKFLMMESTLNTCHASLLTAITALHNLRAAQDECDEGATVPRPVPTLRSPSARRPRPPKPSGFAVNAIPVEICPASPTDKASSPPGLLEPFQWEVVSETSSSTWQSFSFLSLNTSTLVDPTPQILTPASRPDIADALEPSLGSPKDQESASPELETARLPPDALDVENGKFNGSVKENLLQRSTVQERKRRARALFGYR